VVPDHPKTGVTRVMLFFLSILSIKCRNWFYWADTADRAEITESSVFMHI